VERVQKVYLYAYHGGDDDDDGGGSGGGGITITIRAILSAFKRLKYS